MRIVGGLYRSRLISAVKGYSTRSTMDMVKEALFTRLGDQIIDKRGLDLFAGSGSVGLEAISRGMKEVVFVDGAQAAIDTIHHNIKSLGCEKQSIVLRMDAFQALRYLAKKQMQFDFIYIDPPYDKVDMLKLLHLINTANLLTETGIIVLEHPTLTELSFDSAYIYEKKAVYGTVALSYLRRNHE